MNPDVSNLHIDKKTPETELVDIMGGSARWEIKVHDHGLVALCDGGAADVVLTVGGTGVRPTDVVPDVTREVAEKEIPGIGEAMRQESLKKVQTAMLSRGTAAVRAGTLIVNLPGSPRGARENLGVVLPVLEHTVGKIQGR